MAPASGPTWRRSVAASTNLYWQQPQAQPTTYSYPTWWVTNNSEAERLRFALELIAEGDMTKEVIQKIAKKALKK